MEDLIGPGESHLCGVFREPYTHLWVAVLDDGDDTWHLGSFPTFAEAATYYLETGQALAKIGA